MEEAWEFAVVSEEKDDPFLFSWSSKHTRLSFQMFISALLATAAVKYDIESLNFFGMIKFENAPERNSASIIFLIFSIYSLICFLVRSVYEAPKLNSEAKGLRSTLRETQSVFKECKSELQNISKNENYKYYLSGGEYHYFPEGPDANAEVPDFAYSLYQIFRRWSGASLNNLHVIQRSTKTIPKKYLDFGNASNAVSAVKIEALQTRVKCHDGNGNFLNYYARKSEFKANKIEISGLDAAELESYASFVGKQGRTAFKLRLRFWNALFVRFLDIYVLPVLLPAAVSSVLLSIAVKDFLSSV